MSDPTAFGFGKFVPGFDFLQNLAKSASPAATGGSAIPGMSSWVAPTLSVEELDKRIQELKAVQFWLEQNGTALKATIQALEVQKMTLTTLQGMNVNMAELAKAFSARAPEPAVPAGPEAAEPPAAASAPEEKAEEPASKPAPKARRSSKPTASKVTSSANVDPMQWWGSLTQQFQNIATSALQDVAGQAMKAKASAPSSAAPAAARTRATAKPAKAPAKTARKSGAAQKARSSRP